MDSALCLQKVLPFCSDGVSVGPSEGPFARRSVKHAHPHLGLPQALPGPTKALPSLFENLSAEALYNVTNAFAILQKTNTFVTFHTDTYLPILTPFDDNRKKDKIFEVRIWIELRGEDWSQ